MPEYTGVTNIVIQFCVDLKANPPVLTNYAKCICLPSWVYQHIHRLCPYIAVGTAECVLYIFAQ